MQLNCPHCQRVLEFSGPAPSFCGYCGQSLGQVTPGTQTATAEQPFGQASTLPPDPTGTTFTSWTSDRPDQILAGYRLVRELGSGGMGVVWEAEQTGSGRRVALKLLAPGRDHSSDAMDRFVREGRLAAALSHPRSTFVFEAGTRDGRPFICMELMPGRTLADVCREDGPLPVARAVDYMLDVIEGLEAAHATGVIHRDVKPSNCFLDTDGRLKVGDFGLSKSLVDDAALTRTGAFLGTPMFAAPEQVRGSTVDERTDVYSVGATLFSMIAGKPPFTGIDAAAVIAQIACDPAPPLRQLCPAVPEDLDRIIARTLEKEPSRRYRTMTELKQALLPFSSNGLIAAPQGRRLGAYLLDMLFVGITGGVVGTVTFCASGVFSNLQSAGGNAQTIIASPEFANSMLVLGVFVIVSPILYFALLEGLRGASIGKRLLKLRVIRGDGNRPGFARAITRALMVPGLAFLMGGVLSAFSSSKYVHQGGLNRQQTLFQQFLNLLPILPTALCLATMRARNGYRGVHELVTGTRVVMTRPVIAAGWGTEIPFLKARPLSEERPAFGPFVVRGILGRSGGATVFAASDEALKRPVWIFVRAREAAAVSTERTHVARPTRQRWLQGGEIGNDRWDAFEALYGVPWPQFPYVAWEHGRYALSDLAGELDAATDDNTLPPVLSLDQLWLDFSGRAKLLDAPLETKDTAELSDSAETQKPELDAIRLLREAAKLCAHGPDLPVHAVEFVDELERRPPDRATLRWSAEQLRDLITRPAAVRWYDRLIGIGVSYVEQEAYQKAIGLLALALLTVNSVTILVSAVFGAALLLPTLVGYWTKGGPVFSLVGLAVRRADGGPASRVRCAIRNLVAWSVTLFALGMIMVIVPMFAPDTPPTPGQPPAFSFELLVSMLFSCGSGFLMLISLVGMIYAILSPQRGVQDIIAGTRLVPK